MRKETFVALFAAMLILCGVTLANAGQFAWTIFTHADVTGHGPGADLKIGTGDDPTGQKCNFSSVKSCSTAGAPTIGSYSFSSLDVVQVKSCMLGANSGKTCTTNTDCPGGMCMDCGDTVSYFGNVGGTKGKGTFTACQQSGAAGGFDTVSMSIGSSEAVPGSGGGCLTLTNPVGDDHGTPCGVGAFTSILDLELWVTALIKCDFDAGTIPNIGLDGRVFQKGVAAPAGACGYTNTQIDTLLGKLPSTATYMYVACESQTLPALATACLSGADFDSVVIAYTTAAATVFDCNAACASGGCLMGTAEDVQ